MSETKHYSKEVGGKILELIELFEIPPEYHHALWEAFSAGANYGFFKALTPKPNKLGE